MFDQAWLNTKPSKHRLVSFSMGQKVHLQDEQGHHMAYIFAGSVLGVIDRAQPMGATQAVSAYNAGHWIGINGVVSDFANIKVGVVLDYQAVCDVSLLFISYEYAKEMMTVNESFRQFMMSQMMRESIELTKILMQAKYGNPVFRVIGGLAHMAASFADSHRAVHAHLGLLSLSQLKLPFTQSILAELFGVSRSVISPILRHLENQGLLDLQYGQTVLLKPAAWCYLSERLSHKNAIPKDLSLKDAVHELSVSDASSQPNGISH